MSLAQDLRFFSHLAFGHIRIPGDAGCHRKWLGYFRLPQLGELVSV